jgi:hypothetical protein
MYLTFIGLIKWYVQLYISRYYIMVKITTYSLMMDSRVESQILGILSKVVLVSM